MLVRVNWYVDVCVVFVVNEIMVVVISLVIILLSFIGVFLKGLSECVDSIYRC